MYQNQYQRKIEPGIEVLILIGLLIAGFIVGSAVTIPIWMIMTGKGIFDMGKDMLNPAYVDAVKTMQVVSTIIIFFIPAFVTARIVSGKPFAHLGLKGSLKFNRAVLAVFIMLAALPLVAALADLNKAIPLSAAAKKFFDSMESQYAEQVKLMATFKTPTDYIVALFIIALMPAIVEEVFFRGAMQSSITRSIKVPWLAIIITSIIFSVVHFSWYGFIPRVALGMVLGYIFYYTGNLWYSIIGHFFNNALMVTILYYQYMKEKKIDMEVGESAPWWAGVASAAVLIGLFVLLKRESATKVYADSLANNNDGSNNRFNS